MKELQARLVASILICTRNRANYLLDTIKGAATQELSSGGFEIVVVDNGSTDCTSRVVSECQATISHIPLRYIIEPEVGLSAARNRGIQEANGEILCFLDDDAIPESAWLEGLVQGYGDNPRVMCVGGAIVPVYEISLPVWFHSELEFNFKPVIVSDKLHKVKFPNYPYGANFSIRSGAAKLFGYFNTSLGYKGRKLIPSEETEFLLRLEKAGYEILMEPNAIVKHIIPASRLSRQYTLRHEYSYGRGYALLRHFQKEEVKRNTSLLSLIHKFLNLCFLNLRLHFRYLKQRMRHPATMKPDIFYRQCRLATDLGDTDQELIILWNRIRGEQVN